MTSAETAYTTALPHAQHDKELSAEIHTKLGNFAYRRSQFRKAQLHYRDAQQIAQSANDTTRIARLTNNLGLVAATQGQTTEAEQLFIDALQRSEACGDDHLTIAVLQNLGMLLDDQSTLK